MTILRSIDFSRATASAICNSSSLFALIPACAMRLNPPHQPWLVGSVHGRRLIIVTLFGALLGAPQRFANELVGEHEARLGYEPDRQADDLAAQLVQVDLDANLLAFHALERATEPLASRNQLLHLDLGLVARPILEIGRPHEGPVDAGRGQLERVLPLYGVVRVEHRRKAARDIGALFHRNR